MESTSKSYEFNDIEQEPPVPNYTDSNLYGDVSLTTKIIVESETKQLLSGFTKGEKFSTQKIVRGFLNYLKSNAIFLSVIFIFWFILGTKENPLWIYRIPIVGKVYIFLNSEPLKSILIFITATYNGPMDFFKSGLSPYTFLVGLTGKATYLLAMTGVVIPSIKGAIKYKGSEIEKYKNLISIMVQNVKAVLKNNNLIGLALIGAGGALFISNLLTRNGKIDKTFVLFLLAFTLLKGLSGIIPSSLDYIARVLFSLSGMILGRGQKNYSTVHLALRTGAILGFLVAVGIGSFGEKLGYYLGVIAMVIGKVLTMLKKGNR